MLGSMYSAVSGLSAHQTKMNVIGNNIANVNTYGFKSSRVTFTDVFYQTMSGSSGPTSSAGGTNPSQLGYGAMVKSVDVINTRAGSATTDRPLDVYINGEGYLPVKDSGGIIKYTRVGVLSFDVEGNLVDSAGNMVLGIAIDSSTGKPKLNADGTVSARELVPIKVDPKEMDKFTGIAISSKGEITAIKEGEPVMVPAPSTGWLLGADIKNSTLYSGNVTMSIERDGDEVSFLPGTIKGSEPAAPIAGISSLPDDVDINGRVQISYDGTDYTLHFTKKDGTAESAVGTLSGGTVTFDVDNISGSTSSIVIEVNDNENNSVMVDGDGVAVAIGSVVASKMKINATTYDKSGAEVKIAATWDANQPDTSKVVLGDMTINLDPGRFGSMMEDDLRNSVIGNIGPGAGIPTKIANLAVVNFANSDGLSQSGEGYYVETENSGQPVGTIPGDMGTGSLRSGALEMSNVDLSREFTEMIIAQRGFQANTRMITVSDEMLSELVNMKR